MPIYLPAGRQVYWHRTHMRFSYNWLQSFFKNKLPEPEKLAEILTMKSFEVEEVAKKNSDYLLDIDILPNRAHDCLSHFGLAREIVGIFNFQFLQFSKSKKIKFSNKNLLRVDIENPNLVPRYTAYVVEGVEIKESPDWLKERLASVGQKPINNIVDLTNYIMWELGQPLHAFDLDKVMGAKMVVRESKKGEKLETLDGERYVLDKSTLVIEDGKRLIDLAGIKGGKNTQVDTGTSRIVLQAAIFNAERIRKTMQNLGARTEASVRYMHGFDLELSPEALNLAVEVLSETNPKAEVVQKIDIYPSPAKPKEITFYAGYARSLLGLNIKEADIKRIFKRLGFRVNALKGKEEGALRVKIPTYRLDVSIQEDLIEELGRVFGYESIGREMPTGVLTVPQKNEKVFWRGRARSILTGLGFSEVYNYSLVSEKSLEPSGVKPLELSNPISDEYRYLRSFLLPSIFENISLNAKREGFVKLFEIGKVFSKNGNEVAEEDHIVFALSRSFEKKDSASGFYEIKGYADELLNKLGLANFYYDPDFLEQDSAHASFLHSGRRANIRFSGTDVLLGFLGEAHPSLREEYKIGHSVFCAELDFEKLVREAVSEHNYEPPSKYPEIVRDIAVMMPRDVMVIQVLNVINGVSGELLRDVDLFDIYEGKDLPYIGAGVVRGMKNLAFHLIFQSEERTLTSKEIDEIMSRIAKALKKKGWEVR